MRPHTCLMCECVAEPPFAFMMVPNRDDSACFGPAPPVVICQECMAKECTVDQIERDIQRGVICHLCFEPFDSPGGTTMPTLDGRRLLRVCRGCKKIFHGERAR